VRNNFKNRMNRIAPVVAMSAGLVLAGLGSAHAVGVPVDVTAYGPIFDNNLASALAAVTGPGASAMGILAVGCIFGVAWKLTRKGLKSIG
jgi:hypothetical protein